MKVLLVDDHALFRDGMRYVLQQLAAEVEVIDAGTFADGLKQIANHPDIELALLDLNMPGSQGADSIRQFHLLNPHIPLVVVSGSEQREDIQEVMGGGAMGFISKRSPGKIMLAALRMVLDGGIYLPPQLLQQTMAVLEQEVPDKRYRRSDKSLLTARQLETLRWLSQGLSNKEISERMGLAEGTVKIHTAAVYQALQVNSRMEAANTARSMGLIPALENEADGSSKH